MRKGAEVCKSSDKHGEREIARATKAAAVARHQKAVAVFPRPYLHRQRNAKRPESRLIVVLAKHVVEVFPELVVLVHRKAV